MNHEFVFLGDHATPCAFSFSEESAAAPRGHFFFFGRTGSVAEMGLLVTTMPNAADW